MGLLDGKVAIITGGGKGIGFGIASAFAEQGASLFITGRTEGRLADAAEKAWGEIRRRCRTPLPRLRRGPGQGGCRKECVRHFGNLTLW